MYALEEQFYKKMYNANKDNDIKLNKKQEEVYQYMCSGESIFMTGVAGVGKCLGYNTPVIMVNGNVKMVQDIVEGEVIMGDDSTPRRILSTVIGKDNMYKITNNKGDSYVVNSHHILTFKATKSIRYRRGERSIYLASWGDKSGVVKSKDFSNILEAKKYLENLPDLVDLPLKDCLDKQNKWNQYFQGIYAKLEFPEIKLEYDPYLVGLLLGDGNNDEQRITNIDNDILKYIEDILQKYDITYQVNQTEKRQKHLLSTFVENMIKNKHIPYEYKINTAENRLLLLAGLIDTDGSLSNNCYEIIQKSKKLAEDIYFVAKSLGFQVCMKECVKRTGPYYSIYISGNTGSIPVKNPRKKANTGITNKKSLVSPIKIEYIGVDNYYGFEIDGNRRFVLGNFIITHNTAVIKMFMRSYASQRIIAITSTTGTSALLLNGTTLHSYLGIGYGKGSVEAITTKILDMSWLKRRWIKLQTLIIDEVSMLDPILFDKLEIIARNVRRNNKPFGGIQLILSGDFLQLPCVGTDKFCFEADSWLKCIKYTIYLDQIIRQSNVTFQGVLNDVRLGQTTEEVRKILDSRIGVSLVNDFGIKPTRLYSLNRDVDRINESELDALAIDKNVQFYEYEMDIVVYPTVNNKVAAMEKFKKDCNAPEILQVCTGAQVMLLKNLDLTLGLANGSRGVVINFFEEKPVVKFLNGQEKIIDWEVWEVEENDKKILSAKQIPLRVAYAISIHKSQGSSLDYAEIDLSTIFEYGQAYVALSRVKSLEGLSIINVDYNHIKANPKAVAYYKYLENNKHNGVTTNSPDETI